MTKMINPARLRGFAVARADASNPTAILNEMRTAFEAFKAERTRRPSTNGSAGATVPSMRICATWKSKRR